MKTLKQQATEMRETIDSVDGEKKYARLTPSDRALIFRLAAKGHCTKAEIAKAVGCDPSTVTRTLQLLDARSEARTILESGAARLADTVVKTTDAANLERVESKHDQRRRITSDVTALPLPKIAATAALQSSATAAKYSDLSVVLRSQCRLAVVCVGSWCRDQRTTL